MAEIRHGPDLITSATSSAFANAVFPASVATSDKGHNSMAQISIKKAHGKWSIRAGGAVLGETTNALALLEEGRAPVIYFPASDVATAFLERSSTRTHCPHKGDATHFSIVTKSTTLQDAVWSYETPNADLDAIKGYLAFYPSDQVFVEQI